MVMGGMVTVGGAVVVVGGVVVVVGGVVVVVGGVVVVVGGVVVVVVGGLVVVVGGRVVVVGGRVVVVGGLVLVVEDGGFFDGDEVALVVGFDLSVEPAVEVVVFDVDAGVNPLVNGNASLFDVGGAAVVVVVGAEAAGALDGMSGSGSATEELVGGVAPTAESETRPSILRSPGAKTKNPRAITAAPTAAERQSPIRRNWATVQRHRRRMRPTGLETPPR
jgi:hypothetical protein